MSNRLVPGFTPPRVPYRKAFDPSCGCEKRILKPPAGFHAMTTGRMRGDILRRPNYNHVHERRSMSTYTGKNGRRCPDCKRQGGRHSLICSNFKPRKKAAQ